MNKEYQHSETIEAYLRNELSEAERADFEQLVRQDPLLYNEFLLQQEIVSGLQSYRKAQLKNRLNQIDVTSTSSWGGAGTVTAWIGGLALVGLLSWLGYNYLGDPVDNTIAVTTPASAQTPESSSVVAGNIVEKNTQETDDNKPSAATTDVIMTESAKPVTVTRSKSKASAKASYVESSSEINPKLQEEGIKKADMEPATDKLPVYGNTPSASNRLNVVDNTNESLKLHYYYRNGRIALLGFEKPYTFLDLPSENITYLHYEGNFYKLNTNQTQPTAIQNVLVTDQAVVDSLNKLLTERK